MIFFWVPTSGQGKKHGAFVVSRKNAFVCMMNSLECSWCSLVWMGPQVNVGGWRTYGGQRHKCSQLTSIETITRSTLCMHLHHHDALQGGAAHTT